jgi:hypothetical protein
MNTRESIRLPAQPEHALMTAIGRGLPITLLVDLLDPSGPHSHEMYEREGKTADDEVLVIPEATHVRSA